MSLPLGLSTEQPNNAWMQEMPEHDRRVDRARAVRQFRELYATFLAARAAVYLLPSGRGSRTRRTWGISGSCCPTHPIRWSSRTSARSPGGASRARGSSSSDSSGLSVEIAPPFFEGEADLKHLDGNVYVGAHGLRTSREALRWFEERFDMEVIPFEIESEYLYHLDCSVFPIMREEVMVCTELAAPETLAAIERHATIIDVCEEDAESGVTNCVLIGEHVLCASNIEELSEDHEDYPYERKKIQVLEEICAKRSLTPVFFNLSEFLKSGAMLSCMIMHLNHKNF